MTKSRTISRRTALKLATGASALPLVHMQTAHAAGTLKLGLWDHFVPGANETMSKLVATWAAQNKVEAHIDFLGTGSANSKLQLAESEEALAQNGHDVMTFLGWGVQQYHEHLEPIGDVVEGLTKKYGKIDPTTKYFGTVNGEWMALATSVGSVYNPSVARISWFKKWGHDVQAWYPNKTGNAKSGEAWTYELMLKLAPKAQKAGKPLGLGLGLTPDSVDWTGALLRAYGAVLVDDKGEPHLRTDPVLEVLEYLQKLYPYLPPDTSVYTDSSNNRALISDKSALIFNPPSAWAVAVRDAIHVAEDCWHFPAPRGPRGRYLSFEPFFWGIWSFSRNKTAAKELIGWLQERSQVEALCSASKGFDMPPLLSMHDFPIWSTEAPPPGVIYNYPIRPWHDATSNVSGYPAPPNIGTQLYTKATFNVMVVKLAKNKEKLKDVLDWGEREISSYGQL